ncbi:hypothetical protein [Bradyrhizobium sp. CCBAU 65884]|uniref:hypothetical protein n=1 Tax=Bradyrhizobium sp. CCBAU 65884 TaxID=722477 RepID=UPI0023066F4F|nr:hypothetical protein [Bradyrhizobium sp. CCBAU 65884]
MIANKPSGEVADEFRRKWISAFAITRRGRSTSRRSFRAPEVLAAIVPVKVACAADRSSASQPLLDLAAGQVRRAADGWDAVLRIGSADYRVCPRTRGASLQPNCRLTAISKRERMQPGGWGV